MKKRQISIMLKNASYAIMKTTFLSALIITSSTLDSFSGGTTPKVNEDILDDGGKSARIRRVIQEDPKEFCEMPMMFSPGSPWWTTELIVRGIKCYLTKGDSSEKKGENPKK